MTSPRAARLAAAAAVALAVVVVLPGRHAALAAPNDYASDSSSVSDGDGSPLPVANTDVFDLWDHAANHNGPPPDKPYHFLDSFSVPEAAFVEFTDFITARMEADIDLAKASVINAAESIFGLRGPETSRSQKRFLEDQLTELIGMARPGDALFGAVHPKDYERRTVATWIFHFAMKHCDVAKKRLTDAQSPDSPYFGEYYIYRSYLGELWKTVKAVQSMAVNFAIMSGEQMEVVQYVAYKKHYGNLDAFLEIAGSLITVLEKPYMDDSLFSDDLSYNKEKLLDIERAFITVLEKPVLG